MTTLLQQIEEMRVQVNELAGGEQKLLHSLSDALTRADHQLLHDVRNVAAEHERRRTMILKELQALALSIGSFPVRRDSVMALEEAPSDQPSLRSSHLEDRVAAAGDWRRAASNVQDELDFQLNGRGSTH
jgi:hypothetical protein